MVIHNTPVDLFAKSVSKKKLLSSKRLGRKRQARVPVRRIATWKTFGFENSGES